MIRTLFFLWFVPVSAFWSWFLLSWNDIVFSRDFHDRVFALYGEMLGMEPALIPVMMAKALVLDCFIILAIASWRKRKTIAAFLGTRPAARS